jgi:ribosomal protein L20A (L18A)
MLGADSLKSQVTKLISDEDYKLIAELLNEQIKQQEKILDISGAEYTPREKIEPEKIKKAFQNMEVEEAVEAVLKVFNSKQKVVQRNILRELDLSEKEIKEEFV